MMKASKIFAFYERIHSYYPYYIFYYTEDYYMFTYSENKETMVVRDDKFIYDQNRYLCGLCKNIEWDVYDFDKDITDQEFQEMFDSMNSRYVLKMLLDSRYKTVPDMEVFKHIVDLITCDDPSDILMPDFILSGHGPGTQFYRFYINYATGDMKKLIEEVNDNSPDGQHELYSRLVPRGKSAYF